VEHLLNQRRRAELDGLLAVDPQWGVTRLTWLGRGPTQATPGAVKTELEKLAYLRNMEPWTCRACPRNGAGTWPGSGAAPAPRPWRDGRSSAGIRSC